MTYIMRLLAAFGGIAVATAPALAEPLSYTITTSATGILGTTAFSDRAITIALTADPDANIASFGLAPTSQTITIGGLGTFGFTNQLFFGTSFDNVFYLAGRNTTPFVRDFLDVQLPDYVDVYAPFDAVSGQPTPTGLRQFTGIATSGGALGLTRASSVTLIAAPFVAAAVPEPASWAMMIAGFGLAGVALRRRRLPLATA